MWTRSLFIWALVGDVWLIASDAKPMTATPLMKLVDRGLLSLDAPLADLLPELVAGMHRQYRRVTLRELLSHRFGLPEDILDPEAKARIPARRWRQADRRKRTARRTLPFSGTLN